MTWFCAGPGSLYRACGIGDIHCLLHTSTGAMSDKRNWC
jgi:hypothetical protein